MLTEALQTSPEAPTPSPLESTSFNLDIEGLLARLSVRQRYINRESIPIEAVFTFPMAMDATLLELQVVRNEQTLTGRVKARTSARLQYEEGVEAGHTAILLERSTADS